MFPLSLRCSRDIPFAICFYINFSSSIVAARLESPRNRLPRALIRLVIEGRIKILPTKLANCPVAPFFSYNIFDVENSISFTVPSSDAVAKNLPQGLHLTELIAAIHLSWKHVPTSLPLWISIELIDPLKSMILRHLSFPAQAIKVPSLLQSIIKLTRKHCYT